jgi:hypothetical protein
MVTKMAKSTENKRPDKATSKTPRRAKAVRPNVRFEATINNDHVDLRATAPAKWFRVLLRVLIIIVIALVILKMPELWQAIQAAINLMPK